MRQKGFTPILVLLVIVVVIVGVFILGSKNKSQTTSLPTSPSITTTPLSSPKTTTNPAASWKTYSNSKYNISFKYPPDWTLTATDTNYLIINIKKLDNTQEKIIGVTGNEEEALYGINISIPNYNVEIPNGAQKYSVGGYPGYQFQQAAGPSSGLETDIVVNANGKNYLFTYGALAHLETHTKFIDTFYQILGTFKFTK